MRYSDIFYKKSSRILLGTAYFGDVISEREAFEILDKYVSMGGTHIDTARLYADGRSEEIVGKWVKERKAFDIHVSTKGGFPDKQTPNVFRLSEKEIRKDIEASLKATKFNTIDFYWLHNDDKTREVGEIMETLNSLKKEGKLVDFGVSNWTLKRVDEAQKYAKAHGLSQIGASQIRFNPAHMNEEGKIANLVGMDRESFEYYRKNNIPVVAYSSQAKGFFSKMAEEGNSALSDKARIRYLNEENLRTFELLKGLSKKYSVSIASIITGAFCSFSMPEVFPIIGGRTVKQIEDSMLGGDIVIPEEVLFEIFRLIL